MKDTALRNLITILIAVALLILFVEYLVLPGLIRGINTIHQGECQAAYEATGYISDYCAQFMGR